MQNPLLRIAASVVARSDREHPADRVLRESLRSARFRLADDSTQVAHAVFEYFRWRGWLDLELPAQAQIEQALRLAERFAHEPEQFPDADLIARAVPSWTDQELPVTSGWVRALQREPTLWLRAKKGEGAALAQTLGDCRPAGAGALADALEYRGRQDLFRTAEFHAGAFEVQDLSSQVVGIVCDPRPGQTWWDACAGEGGKTLHLSELMENRGLIWATDRSAWRLHRLKRRTARAKVFNYRTALWRETAVLPTKTKFDGVLLDAPCSGIGTWQRNPHARWTISPTDVQELAALQDALLASCAPALKSGGTLVYSVCTLARSETSAVADRFEAQFPNFKPVAVLNPLVPQAAAQPRLVLRPEESGGNGMFIAVWRAS